MRVKKWNVSYESMGISKRSGCGHTRYEDEQIYISGDTRVMGAGALVMSGEPSQER